MNSIFTFKPLKYWAEILLTATVYFLSAKLGQLFAIPPGNISPVWLPSGLMVALIFIRGYSLWPGIFLGALAGNVSAYLDVASLNNILSASFSGVCNGAGDTIGILLSVHLFKKLNDDLSNIFSNLASFRHFILFCTILSSLVSALFGVTSLALVGFIDWSSYTVSLLTWWAGDAMGVLLLTPLIMAFKYPQSHAPLRSQHTELIVYSIGFCGVCFWMYFQSSLFAFLPNPLFLLIPLLLWAILRLGFKVTFISTLIISVIMILIISNDQSSFQSSTELEELLQLQFYLSVILISVFGVGVLVNERNILLSNLQTQLNHDPLTGALTRSSFMGFLDIEFHRLQRYRTPFSLVMIDIDYFKLVNDTYGHLPGDEVLKEVTHIIKNELRGTDSLSRWGGEEFILLLPNTNRVSAFEISERCRSKVEKYNFNIDQKVTISLGVYESQPHVSAIQMISNVDSVLYESKNNGRNKVTAYSEPA